MSRGISSNEYLPIDNNFNLVLAKLSLEEGPPKEISGQA
jgi:hypothetical protein